MNGCWVVVRVPLGIMTLFFPDYLIPQWQYFVMEAIWLTVGYFIIDTLMISLDLG